VNRWAMTFFDVRHKLRMWHDCGVTRSGGRAILANSGNGRSAYIPNSHGKSGVTS
jgi:hypothetical protein